MRALLDVNVLIALLDAAHVSHQAAMEWFATHGDLGWASCPITQNGCLRIMSSPAYPNARPFPVVAERLAEATRHAAHQFWTDDVSVLDSLYINTSAVLNGRHLTDLYLLALAVRHHGRLVTFDRSVPAAAVVGAEPRHLIVL